MYVKKEMIIMINNILNSFTGFINRKTAIQPRRYNNSRTINAWMMALAGVALTLIMSSCNSEYSITPPTVFNYKIPPGTINTSNTLVKLFVNDYQSRVVYVGEEFEIKVVLYNMPPELFAAAMDIQLNNNIKIESIMYDTSSAGYFAPKESTLTILLQYPENPSKVSFVKTYRSGTTPDAGSRGILFKIRCRATSKSDGFISILPTNLDFRRLGGEGGVLGDNSEQIDFTPDMQAVRLEIRDDLFVP